MFSKVTIPVVGALISAVVASPIERAVADAIAANAQSEILFAPLPLVGTGNRLAKSAGERTDFGLVQKDDLYWSYPSESAFSIYPCNASVLLLIENRATCQRNFHR